jgi:hypothetical protein|tara:strand:+ start:361 stop:540 length:180 start_codon:yes stop_codon:yes gene_type:complete
MVSELIILICFVLLYLLTLYLFLKGIEYKESTKRLIEQIEELRKANNNLSKIIQEDRNE